MKIVGSLVASIVLAAGPASAGAPVTPLTQDPMGPIVDVTGNWQAYQPSKDFCIKPNVPEFTPGGSEATQGGSNPACAKSGFASTESGLYEVKIEAPLKCAGCRRLFIDFSLIPPQNDPRNTPPFFYAYGRVYFHLDSFNFTYTVDPKAHSPNTKNFTNDKLFVPDGSPQEPFVHAFDLHAIAYTSDTKNFAHTKIQGPWYVGPWYVHCDLDQFGDETTNCRRVNGVYFDVDIVDAFDFGNPSLNEIGYNAGFNAGDAACPDNVLFNGAFADSNFFYGGCADHSGHSSQGVNPFP